MVQIIQKLTCYFRRDTILKRQNQGYSIVNCESKWRWGQSGFLFNVSKLP